MQPTAKEKKQFQEKILAWYAKNKRDLPWRKSHDPYTILVSEVMSQQTQIARVVPKFEAWMQKFPTVSALAQASVAEVLRYWSGLGYNRRALNLKKTAEIIVRDFAGTFPADEKVLLTLPGIGEYTARAVLSFAFFQQVAVVDTNVRKIIVTQFGFDGDTKSLQAFAQILLPEKHASDWNQALMDYAAMKLKKEKILISKQSKFIGSHRYYRGQIIKLLLQEKKVSETKIGLLIKKDYTFAKKKWLSGLLQELIDEGFIVVEQGMVRLVS